MTENAKRLRRERKKRQRLAADLPFKCPIDGCTASYASANGRGQHLRRDHAVLGAARRTKTEREQLAETQERFERIRSFAVRGDKIDSRSLWVDYGDRIFPRRSGETR